MRKRYAVTVALGLLLGLAVSANAAVLWNQSTIDPNGSGIASSVTTGFGGGSVYSVNDVTVPASGWVITRVTQYYSGFNTGWVGGITQGYLTIIPKSGALPTGTPSSSLIPMSGSWDIPQSTLLGQDVMDVVANVNIALPPGDYWIGLAPKATAGINGINQVWPAAMVATPVATYAPAPWANYYGNYDMSQLIEGDFPTPAKGSTWGAVKALYH